MVRISQACETDVRFAVLVGRKLHHLCNVDKEFVEEKELWLRLQPLQAAITFGLVPFLLGDALKLALAACLLPVAWKIMGHSRQG